MLELTKEELLRMYDFEIKERKRNVKFKEIKNLSDEELLRRRDIIAKELESRFNLL